MARNAASQFEDRLRELLRARTHAIISAVWAKPGAAPKFTTKKVRRAIGALQQLAEEALLRSRNTKSALNSYDYKRQWHPKKGKGHGKAAKKKAFKLWYENKITTANCVYAFWGNGSCLYVGRTLNGKGRPSSHFDKYWFGRATRLDIYGFDRKRNVPLFECLLTHRHEPSYSKITPAKKKYYTVCPVCDCRREIKDEIKSIFRLK